MTPPLDLELQLRRHGAALRALAAQLLRGPAADDAVQELWLTALREPPRDHESVGGWLRTVLLHIGSRFRRQQARRERHETRAARPDEVEDHAIAVAREEACHRLVAAVGALEPVYRDAIWQRFFEGKAPRDIAAASGVPIATVKSRLQRGLATLRARLAADGGEDWRARFATPFGLGSEGTAAALAAGGVVMATWLKVTGGVLAAALALAVWTSWPDPGAPPSVSSPRNDPAALATAATRDTSAAAGGAPHADAAPERAAAPAPAANDPKLATIRGRCVDEHGKPIAGCKAALSSRRSSRERVDAWLRDHPEPDWKNPPRQVTGQDGVFAFTFWPPPPFSFSIDLDGEGLAAMGARWNEIAEGRIVDLGDVVMVPGVLVQGRVVDDAGAAIAKASISVWLGSGEPAGESETPTFDTVYGSTAGDGTFRCQDAVRPGPCFVHVTGPGGQQLPQPLAITLTRERPVEDVVLVLPRPAEVPTITGRVVDEAGQPIREASLVAHAQEDSHTFSASTRRDGTFTLKKDVTRAGGSVAIGATHPLFEPVRAERVCPWGSTDVVLTMRAAGGLAVYARDEDGALITDFTVRAVPRDTNGSSSSDGDVRSRGPYPSGFAAVPGIQRGSWTVVVEFPTALQRASVATSIEKTTNDTMRVDVTAHADVRRMIRVVDAKNEPVAGARVRLCLPVDGAFGEETWVSPMENLFGPWSSPRLSRALLLMEGATGADGSLVVTGPRRQPLGVSVHGREQIPVHRAGVMLDDETPLVIAVEQGARLHGVLRPTAVLPALLRLRGKEHLELRLRSTSGPRSQPVGWFEPGFAIGADGAFDCRGLEPGEWKVELEGGSQLELGRVTLRSGESTRLDPDLGYMQTGTLRGTLHKNGTPVRDTEFQVCGAEAGPFAYVNTKTDAAGRFEVQVGAGTYQALVYPRERSGEFVDWRSLERTKVVAGQATEQEFHVWTGELKVVVRDASGAPAPKLRLCATSAGGNVWWLPATDAEGTTTAEIGAESVTLAVLHQPPGAQATTLPLGTATVVTGKPGTVELRLPAEWRQK